MMTKNNSLLKLGLILIAVPLFILLISSATMISTYIHKAVAQNNFASTSSLDKKGDDLFDAGNYTAAIQYYTKALTINSTDTDALNGKANSLANLDNSTGAIQFFDKALSINPKDTDALDGKGFALDALGNTTEAIKYYDKSLAIDPKDPDALQAKSDDLKTSDK